jgi:hypothetical protein
MMTTNAANDLIFIIVFYMIKNIMNIKSFAAFVVIMISCHCVYAQNAPKCELSGWVKELGLEVLTLEEQRHVYGRFFLNLGKSGTVEEQNMFRDIGRQIRDGNIAQ